MSTTETIDVSQTSEVSGASKFIFVGVRVTAPCAIASLIRYDAPLAMTIMMRIDEDPDEQLDLHVAAP